MNISPEEAREALAVIEQTKIQTRKGNGYNGYYLLPGYFYLWEAIFGGLSMLVPGLVLRLRWR